MHKLQKQIINATYYDKAGVDRFYDRALHLFYQDLQPEMERILNKYADPNQLVSINKLNINLGLTYESDLRNQWLSRFKAEFEKELSSKIKGIKNGLGELGESIQSISENDLDILLFFMTSGRLPWQKNASATNISTLFDRLLTSSPAALDKRIRSESKKEQMIARLVLQFTDKQLANLIKVMQPSESTFIIKSAAELRKNQQKNRIVQTNNNAFRDAVWKFMLTYIINQRGSYFNTREFLGAVLYNMAMHFNVEFGWLIQEIFKSMQQLKPEPVHFRLGMILQELYNAAQAGKRIPTKSEERNQQIMLFLSSGKSKKQTESSYKYADLFADWMQSAPLDVKLFLQRNTRSALLRRITDIIAEKEMRQLIRLIAPTEATFVIDLNEEIGKQQDEQQWIKTESKQFQSDFWMVVLELLLIDRGSFFNQKVFVIALFEKLSAHYNLHASFFIEKIMSVLETYTSKFKSTYLLSIFTEIKKEFNDRKSKKPLSEKTKREHHFQYLESFIFEKTNRPEVEISVRQTDVSLSQKAAIDHLLFNDSTELKKWIIAKLKTEEDIIRFSRASDVKQMHGLIKLLNSAFSKSLSPILKHFLQLNQHKPALQYSISEIELLQAALLYLLTTRHLADSETGLTAFIVKYLAKNQDLPATEFVKSLLTESSPKEIIFPKKTRQFLYKEFNIASRSKASATKERAAKSLPKRAVEKSWKETPNRMISAFRSAEELNTWLQHQLKTIQLSDRNKLHKILAFYFNNAQAHHWETQCFPAIGMIDQLNTGSLADQPFLTAYLSDIEKIVFNQKPVFQSVTQDWIKTKIWQLWSANRYFNQQELTSFLIAEMSKQMKTPAAHLQKELFEKALKIQSELSSTLILSLGKNKNVANPITQEIENISLADAPHGEETEDPIEEPMDEAGEEESTTIYINNAGLILIAPFIPALFEKAGLVSNRAFIDEEKKQYAIHLLQYCVNNEEGSPEYQLTLPKLLCGDKLSTPIQKEIRLEEKDKALTNSLLRSVIEQWKNIGETSVEGLQQTFIQRNGLLRPQNKQWELEIEARSFDMLLDFLPWNFSHTKLPWMGKIIFTKWR